jgi:hypothetical protein
MPVPLKYSVSSEQKNFQLPEPGDQSREFDLLKRVAKKQWSLVCDIVFVRPKVWDIVGLIG